MALKLFPIPSPVFAPLPNLQPMPSYVSQRPTTEVRFSRWHNANAEKFELRRRAQQEIEDDIRRHRRFDAVDNIVDKYEPTATTTATDTFKSTGTPSSPSKPSIPGKKSKYSKPETHPAFRKFSRITKLPQPKVKEKEIDRKADIKISEDGLSYVIDGAPFEFKYSYTEAPKVRPLKLRGPAFAPFGPTTMPRPWTGRAPLPASKKLLKEFDSFQLPPPNKKGVKPVQSPGPYLPGSGPRYAKTREEILGEPLTAEEVKELVDGCLKSNRQLNMGRDGFTHNMLDNIHAHWKRRRVCKIKCKGVCTVDMDNVCQQLEEKTGGKVIYRKGGVMYLFRGRNYNYKYRPRFPLMLWKPITPVYPRLIQRAPEGLSLEEAAQMRKKGRKLTPICKLGKNGVYCNLVKHVKEAFDECELVRINCQGMNPGDYRKIGAKLKELLPCVLISFEREHILMWRGRDWKSSFSRPVNESDETVRSFIDDPASEGHRQEIKETEIVTVENANPLTFTNNITPFGSEEHEEFMPAVKRDEICTASEAHSSTGAVNEIKNTLENAGISAVNASEAMNAHGEPTLEDKSLAQSAAIVELNTALESAGSKENLHDISGVSHNVDEPENENLPQVERLLLLLKQAVENGDALALVDENLDADVVYERAVTFGRSAPPGPVFRHQPKKIIIQKCEQQEGGGLKVEEIEAVSKKLNINRKLNVSRKLDKIRKVDVGEHFVDAVPQGSLNVDELAKLLT
ncbi:hypothetical protein K2173_023662 [Erythroxylum novogranatense]|uniref:CRM domain-containing protein n=1 Tax=Erythroxylum novogranatense TaxID=1862640 RepID=A0AAV8TRD1_9ROSI|nr:hypothetical protein K2173_023662 [Erythroxylum novogranatense]